MKMTVIDNAEKECRELWINGKIHFALGKDGLGERPVDRNTSPLELLMSFGEWEPNKIHMSTEG